MKVRPERDIARLFPEHHRVSLDNALKQVAHELTAPKPNIRTRLSRLANPLRLSKKVVGKIAHRPRSVRSSSPPRR